MENLEFRVTTSEEPLQSPATTALFVLSVRQCKIGSVTSIPIKRAIRQIVAASCQLARYRGIGILPIRTKSDDLIDLKHLVI
jgi:hypothetical protein